MERRKELSKMSAQQFVTVMEKVRATNNENLQDAIRMALMNFLGELPAIVALAYSGDASDGDLDGFVKRTEELFGPKAPIILGFIATWATDRASGSK
jgi:hypothetical protein